MEEKFRIAILASGNGSNAENIVKHFSDKQKFVIELIASNKKDAFVLERAKNLNIPAYVFSKADMENGNLEKKFIENKIDFIVLAGFLLKIPERLITKFENRIINIHPALLPKFGGKGMYGDNVHKAVKESGAKETGISIHLVNEDFDKGRIIFQAKTQIKPADDISEIAAKVHKLEYKFFPKIIENYILGFMSKKKRDISL
jgi:phosphoribosylglycinamide formyltransferase-1